MDAKPHRTHCVCRGGTGDGDDDYDDGDDNNNGGDGDDKDDDCGITLARMGYYCFHLSSISVEAPVAVHCACRSSFASNTSPASVHPQVKPCIKHFAYLPE